MTRISALRVGLLGTSTLLAACSVDVSVFGTPGAEGFGGAGTTVNSSGAGFTSGVGGTSATSAGNGVVTSSSGTGSGATGSGTAASSGSAGASTSATSGTSTSATSGASSSASSGASTSVSSAASSSASSSAASSSASSSSSGGGVDHAIPCGNNQSCPGICCLGLFNQDCKTTAAECNQFQSAVACNDGADCAGGELCCLKQLGFGKIDVACATSCSGKGTRALCANLNDCPAGTKSCADATQLGLPGYFYCKN